jgi:hypothetical protein
MTSLNVCQRSLNPCIYFLFALIFLSTNGLSQCWNSLAIQTDSTRSIFAIRNDNTLWNIQDNVQIGNASNWQSCFVGYPLNYAITLDGTLWAFGDTYFENPSTEFYQVSSFTWNEIATSWGNTAAIRSDSTLWYWGDVTWSETGYSLSNMQQIGQDHDWKSISFNGYQVIAIKSNGTLWASNPGLQLTQVGIDSDWKSTEIFWGILWAIKENGTLWFFDEIYEILNSNGQQVGNDNDWVSVVAPLWNDNVHAIKTDGTVWWWPENFNPLIEPIQNTSVSNCVQLSGDYSLPYYPTYLDTYGNIWGGYNNSQAPCSDTINCPGDLVITNEYNQVNLGETAYFDANTSLENPAFIWQSDLGLGFQNLENYGKYSGVNTYQLQITNVQLSEHQQIFRVIAESGNCADTSNISLISLTDTSFNTCEDTIINYITIYDTLTTLISVTDTLFIETIISNINSSQYSNTIKAYPNPTNSILNIDYGAFELMSDCQLLIVNSIGEVIFETEIVQQNDTLDLSQWGGSGSYMLTILDPNGNILSTKQIILQ